MYKFSFIPINITATKLIQLLSDLHQVYYICESWFKIIPSSFRVNRSKTWLSYEFMNFFQGGEIFISQIIAPSPIYTTYTYDERFLQVTTGLHRSVKEKKTVRYPTANIN